MDGGLALFGLGLFLLSIAGLYVRSTFGLAWFLVALALVSMGMAFSESKRLREVSLGLGILLLGGALVGLLTRTEWWMVAGIFLFGVAYLVLWAEFRYTYFGRVTAEQLPHPARSRWRLHWPRRAHRM